MTQVPQANKVSIKIIPVAIAISDEEALRQKQIAEGLFGMFYTMPVQSNVAKNKK